MNRKPLDQLMNVYLNILTTSAILRDEVNFFVGDLGFHMHSFLSYDSASSTYTLLVFSFCTTVTDAKALPCALLYAVNFRPKLTFQ